MSHVKLDENLGRTGAEILRRFGHDVVTVFEQGLAGAADSTLIAACRAEERVLVSLDLDFANPLRFKPSSYSGIAVIRLSKRATHGELTEAMRRLAALLTERCILLPPPRSPPLT